MARKTENSGPSVSAQEALEFHAMGRPGKLEIVATKPVMEGKSVLFKRFADVDSIDLEVDTEDADEFINCVRFLGPSFGGINLEDIKAPECFIIEQRLRELMDIPVFHDDQHGTAIISAAGLINALEITGRDMKTTKMVCNGAGAAGIACIELMKAMGFSPENIILCDTKGVVFQGRTEGMNQWKSAHAVKTEARSLAEALDGADVFLGLSAKGALTTAMVQSMAKNPIIFAMANPDPEITPEEVAEIRTDAIMATGRSDYPNQVNNVLGFPYIFRGALDVRATTINDEMKIAAARALAELARKDVPDDVAAAYQGNRPKFGPNYIIPVPFDPRLIAAIPLAVAKAAMESGVARKPILDLGRYAQELSARRDPIASTLQRIYDRVRRQPKRIVFAEGEEEQVMRAAVSYVNQNLGTAILLGRDDVIKENAKHAGIELNKQGIEIINARLSRRNGIYTDYLYERMQRKGFLFRDCQRLINNDRNHFAACMVALGDADGIVTGVTRNYSTALDDIRRVIDAKPGHRVIGVSIVLARGRTVVVADTAVHDMPNAEQIADIAEEAAGFARRMGYEPRLAMLAYSTFGHPQGERSERVQEAVRILDKRRVDFEYDGEMAADVALNARAMAQYPFIRLTGPANVLIMPAFHSASISTKMLQELGGSTVIGPLLVGLNKPVQIVSLNAKDSDIVNMAAIAAYTAGN
ncbi:MAG: NADP-dependent malic enzyme [Mesorhizobium sp.]|uniref:NADP-dependent malic enzyme n=1 Tax=Mesorhizobium sp. TaxID=1871066 RepID=UPI000FE8C36E|nr:NADP-dependent malic enzyme [Mesorhizobium sp.]RWC90181.1 MAG: NADP-dependent malic enzyme [Mesorhizobium sp.]